MAICLLTKQSVTSSSSPSSPLSILGLMPMKEKLDIANLYMAYTYGITSFVLLLSWLLFQVEYLMLNYYCGSTTVVKNNYLNTNSYNLHWLA